MASTKDLMSDEKHRLNIIINTSVTIVAVVLAHLLTVSYTATRDEEIEKKGLATTDYVNCGLNTKASIESTYSKDYLNIKLAEKASKSDVKEAILAHESKDQAFYNRLESIITLSIKNQENQLETINKRLDRIEQKY